MSFKSLLIWFILYALPLFVAAGVVNWWNAWAYVAANILSIIYVNAVVYKATPDLAQERAAAGSETKKWDKILVLLTVLVVPLASSIVAGLDKRFGWTSSLTIEGSLVALGFFIAASALIDWSMKVNRFYSSHYRIQAERGHKVVSRGPYAFIRHPGYLGSIVGSLAAPILLGSIPAFWVGILNCGLIILRTSFEDRALQAELTGYREYTDKVRYRLIPWAW